MTVDTGKIMDRRTRIFTFLIFLICLIIVVLLITSLVTQQWIISKPYRFNVQNTRFHVFDEPSVKDLRQSRSRKFNGLVWFGLFKGTKILNYGLGDRTHSVSVKDELMRNSNLMPFAMWMTTVICLAIAILFAVVSCIFAVINTVTTPIEIITGLTGLYLWNGLGAFFCGNTMLCWFIHFNNRWKQTVLNEEETNDGWTSENRSHLGLSFLLIGISMILYFVNMFVVYLAIHRPCCKPSLPRLVGKRPEGLIMLY